LRQERGHPAALSLVGVAVLAGTIAVTAAHVAATSQRAVTGLYSPAGTAFPLNSAAPLVDLAPDDDETARDLKKRAADVKGAAVANLLTHVHFSLVLAPETRPVPPAHITSLGPRAPPHARNFDLWRPAWQA
jgi:hypothetical protein